MKPWRAALVTLAAGAMALGSACGGAEEEGEAGPTATAPPSGITATSEGGALTPAATPTLADRAQLEALLKAMALTVEDLPSGFTLWGEEFETNEEAAVDYPDGVEQGLADYARWGRLLGYQAAYVRGVSLATVVAGETTAVTVGTTLYETPGGASEAMAEGKDRVSDPEERAKLLEAYHPGWKDPQLVPMSFVDVGDDTFAYQLTGKVMSGESGLRVTAVGQFGFIRRGRAIGTVVVLADQEPSRTEELEAMARKLDERMREALR